MPWIIAYSVLKVGEGLLPALIMKLTRGPTPLLPDRAASDHARFVHKGRITAFLKVRRDPSAVIGRGRVGRRPAAETESAPSSSCPQAAETKIVVMLLIMLTALLVVPVEMRWRK
jgi:hypothetical protein